MPEDDFLEAILTDPRDATSLEVYADWLEDQGDQVAASKSRYLRLTAKLASPGVRNKKYGRQLLQQLAANLDPAWLAVVSRLDLENCQAKRQEAEGTSSYPIRFDYQCDRDWQDLQVTPDNSVRHCSACEQNVYYCATIGEARKHAGAGHCVAVDLGIIRRKRDLEPEMMVMGVVDETYLREEDERLRPDPVSVARERRANAPHPADGPRP